MDSPSMQKQAIEEYEKEIRRDSTVHQILMSAEEAFAVLTCIQIACKHPANTGSITDVAIGFGKRIEHRVMTTPALKELAESGWSQKEEFKSSVAKGFEQVAGALRVADERFKQAEERDRRLEGVMVEILTRNENHLAEIATQADRGIVGHRELLDLLDVLKTIFLENAKKANIEMHEIKKGQLGRLWDTIKAFLARGETKERHVFASPVSDEELRVAIEESNSFILDIRYPKE